MDNEYIIGNAFDLAEEAWYELEELALPKLRALARSLPQPEQSELLRICRHHVGYATGAVRSECAGSASLFHPASAFKRVTACATSPWSKTRPYLPQRTPLQDESRDRHVYPSPRASLATR